MCATCRCSNPHDGVTTAYTFDPLARLTSLIHSKGSQAINTQTYAYDADGFRIAAGNDISQPLTTQAASASVNDGDELLTQGQTTYTYDANGNRLTESGPNGLVTSSGYSRNRLASITNASGTTALTYNYGRDLLRVARPSGSQQFVLDNSTNVVSLTGSTGAMAPVLTGLGVDSHFASVDPAAGVAFGIGDALNGTSGVTNGSGSLVQKLDYDPTGRPRGVSRQHIRSPSTGGCRLPGV